MLHPDISKARIVYARPIEDGPDKDYTLRFRLTYQGPLYCSQTPQHRGCGVYAEKPKLAKHKQEIRRHFHRQLMYFWRNNKFLNGCNVCPDNLELQVLNTQIGAFNETQALRAYVEEQNIEGNYRFIPLAMPQYDLSCNIDILLLSNARNKLIDRGDLDNRVKTLIDTLRKPIHKNRELVDNDLTPREDETPFYCLLEDDKIITGLAVETDELLAEPAEKEEEDAKWVNAVIAVELRPFNVTGFNLGFL